MQCLKLGIGPADETIFDLFSACCCFFYPEVTIGFVSSVYEVVEGERVEVAVEMRGETDIDVVVYVTTQDLTANGETIEYYCVIDVVTALSLSLSLPQLMTTPVSTRPSHSLAAHQFTTSPSTQRTTTPSRTTSYSNSYYLNHNQPTTGSHSQTP